LRWIALESRRVRGRGVVQALPHHLIRRELCSCPSPKSPTRGTSRWSRHGICRIELDDHDERVRVYVAVPLKYGTTQSLLN